MSSSNSISGEKCQGEGNAVEKHVEYRKLEKLKRLRIDFISKFEHHRYRFLNEFGPIIKDWKEQLPNLHDIFTKQEMDWILMASIKPSSWNKEIVEFVIRSGYKDEPDLDEDGKPILRRTTAVHQIAECHPSYCEIEVLRKLFEIYDKFHVNYTAESGYTHFYIACKYGLDDVVEKFLELGQDPNYLVPETGDSMLYFVAAANSRHPKEPIMQLLLKHGADPRWADKDGRTPLHVICQNRRPIAGSVISMLLENVDELQRTVPIDAQDKWGDTPLLLARKPNTYGCHNAQHIRELLRRGADPILANAKGQTALHFVCQRYENGCSLQLLFEVCDEKEKTLRIDARDNEGNTALHLAIACRNAKMIKTLLMRGADPSLANEEGTTPLHRIPRSDSHDGFLMELFFGIVDEERLPTVDIDTRDNSGRTALEWAVARCFPRNVEMLLDRGADVSGFVFPTPRDTDRCANIDKRNTRYHKNRSAAIQLATATGLLAIVELLETRDYRLDRDAALKLMGFFDEYGLYERMDFSTSKDVDDLVDTLFEEMVKNSTYSGYYKYAISYELLNIPRYTMKACSVRLCEKVSTKFFRDWALDPFMELIHYRLPTECSERIIRTLRNKDLFNICLAAGRSSP